jgi:hypothetical protein
MCGHRSGKRRVHTLGVDEPKRIRIEFFLSGQISPCFRGHALDAPIPGWPVTRKLDLPQSRSFITSVFARMV